MKQADHNPSFTAADIQRYHAGDMTMQERHALEKAALDDPFLADALEGYQHTTTPQIDLAALEQRLATKMASQRKRVLPHFFTQPWMRAAALILLLAGAGWTVYRFAFTEKEDLAIAPAVNHPKQNTPTEASRPPANVDSAALVYTPPAPISIPEKTPQANTPLPGKAAKKPAPPIKADAVLDEEAYSQPAPTAIASAPAERKGSLRETTIAAKEAAPISSYLRAKEQPLHTFKGQILDAQGNPVPHASITVNGNRNSTVANMNGQFSLSTPDSVVNATVAAVGFEVNRVSLTNPEENKTVVLNESSAALSEVVVTGYGTKRRNKNTRPSAAQTKAEVEELEPKDGWSSYNNYINENIQIPEEVASKQIKGEVELSFDVNKSGEPVNIKVEKSLCASCDKEAIRLLQEGPGWKKKKKKVGKVKIRF